MNVKTSLSVLFILVIGCVSYACAQGTAGGSSADRKFSYKADANTVILELSYSGGRIANRDPTPHIRVFGDGRVLIYRASYMKNAGQYELQLTPEELENLLDSFAEEQILSATPEALRAMEAQARTDAGPRPVPQDHGATTNINVQFERIEPAEAGRAPMLNVNRRITLPSAAIEASARASAGPIQAFAKGVKQLEALSQRPDLVKLSDN